MAIFVLHSVLRTGKEGEYDRVHARVPDDLLSALEDNNIRDWSIWRSGRDLFHLVECDDLDEAMRGLEQNPANQRWQAFIGDYVDHFETAPSGSWALPRVWRLREQADEASN